MKITIPENVAELPQEMDSFILPEFVNKMDEFISRAKQLKKNLPNVLGDYSHLGIVGIGGSQVQPLVFKAHATVSTTHLEVPDPYILKTFLEADKKNTRVIYCSRSGTTNEVLSFIPYLLDYESLVVTNGGALLEVANQFGWSIVSVTHDISGRFANQNELGIVPMIAMGLDPEEDKDVDFKEHLNPDSLHVLTGCKVEPALADTAVTDRVQFERVGFFCIDSKSSNPDKLVFNRTVTLRDNWAKINKVNIINSTLTNIII